MESAHLNYLLGHTNNAIDSYTNAILLQSSPEAYFARALCYMQQGKYAESIDDLNNCTPCSFSQAIVYKRGVAKFHLGKYKESLQDLCSAATMDAKSEISNSIQVLIGKCKCEMSDIEYNISIGEESLQSASKEETKLGNSSPEITQKTVKQNCPTPMQQDYMWLQTDTNVTIELKGSQLTKENVAIDSSSKTLEVALYLDKDTKCEYRFKLYGEILSDQIETKINPSSVILTLKKAIHEEWPALQIPSKL